MDRVSPAAELAWCIDYFWTVHWELAEPFEQQVVPHPNVHLTFEPDGAFVTGVTSGDWRRRVDGTGCVLGVKFRAAGFRPFVAGPARLVTDRVVPLAELFGDAGAELARRAEPFVAAGDTAGLIPEVERFLLRRPVRDRAVSEAVSAVVDELVDEPAGLRVPALAARLAVTPRQLQRLFAEHVGIGPKWVIDRVRILEAGERARRDPGVRWAELAAELGFTDQAHLTRRFTETVGEPPARYAARR